MTGQAAPCLLTLRDQVNAAYPGRDKASDGMIGDAAHQAQGGPRYNRDGYAISGSDHNPDDHGYVCAFDIDSGPSIDIEQVVAGLTAGPDVRLSYLIWNRRIFSSHAGTTFWGWRPYGGSDPHTNHVHVSVRHLVNFVVNTAPWNIGTSTPPSAVREVTMHLIRDRESHEIAATDWQTKRPLGGKQSAAAQEAKKANGEPVVITDVDADVYDAIPTAH